LKHKRWGEQDRLVFLLDIGKKEDDLKSFEEKRRRFEHLGRDNLKPGPDNGDRPLEGF